MRQPEQDAGENGRDPRPDLPAEDPDPHASQGPKYESAEEELLGYGGDHAHEQRRGDQGRGATADAKLAGQLVAPVELEQGGVRPRDQVVAGAREQKRGDPEAPGSATEAEVGGTRAAAQRDHVHGSYDEGQIDHDVADDADGWA